MKKFLLSLFLISSLALFAQEKNEWEEWQKTSCYSNISFRMKSEPKRGEQFHWKIQFRSNYPKLVSFNYNITDKLEQYSTTTHRKNVRRLLEEKLERKRLKDEFKEDFNELSGEFDWDMLDDK